MAVNLSLSEEKIDFDEGVNLLCHPLRLVIAGPSGSGKSWWIMKLVKFRELLFDTKFNRILYCVPAKKSHVHLEIFNKIKEFFNHAELIFGLPTPTHIIGDTLPKLVIIDDQMQQIFASTFMEEVFIQHSHHGSCSLIFTTQNFFNTGKTKTIIRQCNYKVIFNSPSDQIILRHISCQLKPDQPNFLINVFQTLEELFPSDDYKYILIDGEPKSKMKKLRIRTHIFPNNNNVIEPVVFF
jgi:hypothetical protein